MSYIYHHGDDHQIRFAPMVVYVLKFHTIDFEKKVPLDLNIDSQCRVYEAQLGESRNKGKLDLPMSVVKYPQS